MLHNLPNGINRLLIRGDQDGKLVAVEAMANLPFPLKRMFAIYGSNPDVIRGGHANRDSSFGFLCLAGSCDVRLLDADHKVVCEERLDSPDKLFWIGPMVWKEMYNFSTDCVLTVLSDCLYDPDEYVYDFAEYADLLKA